MKPKRHWVWKVYFIIILLFVTKEAYHLFTPGSPQFLYYFILRSFNPLFHIVHNTRVIHVLLNIIHCAPLFLYIYRIRFLNAEVWKYLFILRCIFEITSHSYEMNWIVALYHVNPKHLLLVLAILITPHIPSYMACYRYAFRREAA